MSTATAHSTWRLYLYTLIVSLLLVCASTANAAVSVTQVKGPGNAGNGAAVAFTPDETFRWSARATSDTGTVSEVTLRWWTTAPSDPANPYSAAVVSSQGELPMTAQADGSYAVSAAASSFAMTPKRGNSVFALYYAITAKASDGSVRYAPSTMGAGCQPLAPGCDPQYWQVERGSLDVASYSPTHGSTLANEPVRFTVQWAPLGAPVESASVFYAVYGAGQASSNSGTVAQMSCIANYCSYELPNIVPAGSRIEYRFEARDDDGIRSATPYRYGGPNGGPLDSDTYTAYGSGAVAPPPPVNPCDANPASCEVQPPRDQCQTDPASCQVQPTPPTVCRIDRVTPSEGTDGDRVRVYGQFTGVPEFFFRQGDTSRRALLDAWSDTEAIIYVPRFELRAAKTTLAVFSDCVVSSTRTRSNETPFVYTTSNEPPVAVPLEQQVFGATSSKRGSRVRASRPSRRLDGTSSYDRDGRIVSYRWKLGKKVVSRKPTTPVAARKTRRYTLCVTDDRGASDCKPIIVKARAPRKVRVTLNNDVLFGFDSHALSTRGKSALRKLRPYVNNAKSIRIEGHASSEGSDAYNLALSKARAQTVRAALTAGMKHKPKTAVRAYGERKPIASNATERGRAKNRRVVITMTLR